MIQSIVVLGGGTAGHFFGIFANPRMFHFADRQDHWEQTNM